MGGQFARGVGGVRVEGVYRYAGVFVSQINQRYSGRERVIVQEVKLELGAASSRLMPVFFFFPDTEVSS